MTETPSSSHQRRGFDWGPPAGPIPDRGTDWGVYLLFALLVAGGAWLLVESAREGSFAAAPESLAMASGERHPTPSGLSASSGEAGDAGISSPSAGVLAADGSPGADAGQVPSAGNAAPPPTFQVQLGAFGDEETAQTTFDQLKAKGYAPRLLAPDDQFEMFRVTMGPYADENEANRIARQLNELDFPCFVIESP